MPTIVSSFDSRMWDRSSYFGPDSIGSLMNLFLIVTGQMDAWYERAACLPTLLLWLALNGKSVEFFLRWAKIGRQVDCENDFGRSVVWRV
ncbi:unnamed protein product [Blepharisma stoltei]|uniref:Uncharacterized protein n=1 Tax=Blepharisma stoltei TaxID=1481888 RepID=A0AAU9JF49_9CILI|nr:unnamed protein product [Blepharisma stoltei]